MRIIIAYSICLFQFGLWSQVPALTYSGNKDSDPKARNILKAVGNKLKLDQGLSFEFSLVTQAAESEPNTQKGKAQIKGDKFNLDLPDRRMVSDGKTLWIYLKKRNEIQIQEAGSITDDPVSPYRLIRIHESQDFVYIWSGESKINGMACDVIEFKPLDTQLEYFKIKAEIDRAKSIYKKITLYFKSGDQYILNLHSQVNAPVPDALFILDPKSYPGAHIEDLR